METRDLDRIRFITRHFHELQGLRLWVPSGLILIALGTLNFTSSALALARVVVFVGAFLLFFAARRSYRLTFGKVEPLPVQESAEPAGVYSLSVFSPGGPLSRIQGFETVPPAMQPFLGILGLAFTVLMVLHGLAPTLAVDSTPPWPSLDAVTVYAERWKALQVAIEPFLAQLACALCGALLLSLWLRRERHRSQIHLLLLSVLMLGIAASGALMGYLVWEDGWLVPVLNLVLPAVVRLPAALLFSGGALLLAGAIDHRELVRALGDVQA